MSGLQRKQPDTDHQNQDKGSDSESADTEKKQEISDTQTSPQTPSMSPIRKALQLFPCCCGKRPSPEPGGPGNKGSASCPQTHTSETQSMTAEPAETSKIPHREKAPVGHKSLLHRLFGSNKEHHTWNHNKHRSEHENDGVLNGCTHGEASQPRPSRDIPKSKNKMKRFFRKTNIKEVTDSEHPTSSETPHSSQECTSTVPHLSTCDIRYSESRKEEADDAASGTLQATYRESDLTSNPRTESPSSSASSIPSHGARSLQTLNSQLSAATFSGRKPGDGCSLTPPLEQTSQPHVAPLPPYSEKYKEVTDSEQPTSSETLHSSQECTSTVPRLSTCDIRYSESREEEADDAASGTLQATYRESDLTTNPRTESQSSSASTIPSHGAHSLQTLNSQLSAATFSGRKPGDGCSLTSPLEQTSQPHVALLPAYSEKYKRGCTRRTQQHLPEFQRWPPSQASLASSERIRFCQRQDSLVNREEEAVQEGTSTTDTLQSADEASGPCSPGQQDDLNVDDTIKLSYIEELVHNQECEEVQEGATAAQNTQFVEDSSKETVCRPLPHFNERYTRDFTPYTQRTHQQLPTFQRLQTYQPSLASARTNFYKRQHPLVEREQDAVQEGTRTTDRLESADEASGSCSSRQQDNLNVDDTLTLSDTEELVHVQECQNVQDGATAAENTQSIKDSSKESVRRPPPHYSERYTRDFAPYTQRTHQHLPTPQGLQTYQPSPASSARTRFYQRQHPLVEREQDAVQEGTRTTETLEFCDEASDSCSSRQQDNLNVDDTLMLSDTEELVHVQECKDVQAGATAAENTQSIKYSSKESVRRPPPHYSERYTRDFVPYTPLPHQHQLILQRWQNSQPSLASSARTNFYQRQHPLVEREQDAVQEGTRTTDPLQSDDEASGSCSSRQRDNLNVDDTITLSDIEELVHKQECKEEQEGATAVRNTQFVEDSSKEIVCRSPPHYNERYTRHFAPYIQQTHQQLPTFQRCQTYQPRIPSSVWTRLHQRRHPQVERGQEAVQKGTRTTDTLESANGVQVPRSSRQQDNLNVDDTLSHIKEIAHKQEREEEQEGATAVRNTQSVEDSSKESVCRPPPHYNERYTGYYAPYTPLPQQQLPTFQRWPTYQPRQTSSARTNFYQRQHPLVERQQDAVPEGTRTTDRLEACDEASGTRSSRQQDNLNVDDTMRLTDIEGQVNMQECEEGQAGATAQNTQSVEDSSKEIECRPKERLSVESSSGEEEDRCRICHSGSNSTTNPLLSPCRCSGSLQFVHLDCLKTWILTKLRTRPNLHPIQRCEVCMGALVFDPDIFDLAEYCRRHNRQNPRWTGNHEARMRFLRRARQFRPPPEASDT